MIIYIITLLFSITSIFISLYLFLSKEKLRNTPHELCADIEGDEFNTCIKKMSRLLITTFKMESSMDYAIMKLK